MLKVLKPKPPKPVIGDRRTRQRFALFPRKVSLFKYNYNKIALVWLETYTVEEQFKEWNVYSDYEGYDKVRQGWLESYVYKFDKEKDYEHYIWIKTHKGPV